MTINVMKMSGVSVSKANTEIMPREKLAQLIKDKLNQYLKEKADYCQISDLVHEMRDEHKMSLGMSNRNLWIAFIELNKDTHRTFKKWDEKVLKYVTFITKM